MIWYSTYGTDRTTGGREGDEIIGLLTTSQTVKVLRLPTAVTTLLRKGTDCQVCEKNKGGGEIK